MSTLANKLNVLIVTLVVVALILGWAIYNKFSLPVRTRATPTSSSSAQLTQINTATPSAQEKSALLKFPGPKSTDQEKSTYFQLASKFAQPSSSLEINNCNPIPLVLWVRDGQKFTINNLESTKHTVQFFNDQHLYKLDANSSLIATADVGIGDHGIFCDNFDSPVGVLHVSSK